MGRAQESEAVSLPLNPLSLRDVLQRGFRIGASHTGLEVEGKYPLSLNSQARLLRIIESLGGQLIFDGVLDTKYIGFGKGGQVATEKDGYTLRIRKASNLLAREVTREIGIKRQSGIDDGHAKVKEETDVEVVAQLSAGGRRRERNATRKNIISHLQRSFGNMQVVREERKQRKLYEIPARDSIPQVHVAFDEVEGVRFVEFEVMAASREAGIASLQLFLDSHPQLCEFGITYDSLYSSSTGKFVALVKSGKISVAA